MKDQALSYVIPFKGLAVGSYVFEWVVDGSFFAAYEMSEISDARVNVRVTLLKHTHFLELDFFLDGWVEVSCDRCLDSLTIDIVSTPRLYVQFGKDGGEEESDESDIVVLAYGEEQMDVAQYIYEYAHLSLPVRRVHGDDENGQNMCNREMIHRLEQYLVNDDHANQVADSRWDDLKFFFEN